MRQLGFQRAPGAIHRNLPFSEAKALALQRREGVEARDPPGALCVDTGEFTGRSPRDRYIERREGSPLAERIDWGEVNQPIERTIVDELQKQVANYLSALPELFVFDGLVSSGPNRLKLRVVTELAWHHAFASNIFIPLSSPAEAASFGEPDFTVVYASGLRNRHYRAMGLNSDIFIVLGFERRLALIAGTSYAGEMKKSVFTIMNGMLPLKGILPLHCAATRSLSDTNPDTICFAGLSGTGKSTLSADPERKLIGDDEHSWDETAIRNMEGGIYVKVIRLSPEKEPILYSAIRKPSTILENVVVDGHGVVQFDDASKTENTRATCPIHNIPQWEASRQGPPPKAFIFLVCDAFGVLPPVSVLTPLQAAYHFILAYTAKVAGTERGVLRPTATFSTCFGAAFMPLNGQVYAQLLNEKLERHGTQVYLVNTGWAGGGAADGAARMDLEVSRAIVRAIATDAIPTSQVSAPDPIFGLRVPRAIPGLDSRLLHPATYWADARLYEQRARYLAERMHAEYLRKGYNPEWAAGGPLWPSRLASHRGTQAN